MHLFHRKRVALPAPRVVFHADDLGFSSAVDDGILDAFEHGVLTSTSVLTNGPTADQALNRVSRLSVAWLTREFDGGCRRQLLDDPDEPFDIGVHLNLTQGRPLTSRRYPAELLDDQGCFPGPNKLFFKLLLRPRRWLSAIKSELNEQISRIVDQGVQPTHANGHQYVELFPMVREILPEVLSRFSIRVVRLPVERRLAATTLRSRGLRAWVLAHIKRHFARQFACSLRTAALASADRFIGTAHAGHVTLAVISNGLLSVQEQITEIAIHPGAPNEYSSSPVATDGWCDPLAMMRCAERDLLCSKLLVDLLLQRGFRLGRLTGLATKQTTFRF
jgi:predicted glycoside hydrolase/deacetylase ChbG (UPF0249 family)